MIGPEPAYRNPIENQGTAAITMTPMSSANR